MCCSQGDCYPSQKSRCRCDCTRCRHCGSCGDKGGAVVGLLVAGAIGTMAAHVSRSHIKSHVARKPWLQHVEEEGDGESASASEDATSCDSGCVMSHPESTLFHSRRERTLSASSVSSQSSISSNGDDDALYKRRLSRRDSTMSGGRRMSHSSWSGKSMVGQEPEGCVVM